jgi:hypothetical protein
MIKDFLKWYKEERARKIEIQDKATVAETFNDRYAYRKVYKDSEHAWMCPECNTIHKPKLYSHYVGLIYPSCCSRWESERWSEGIRTK